MKHRYEIPQGLTDEIKWFKYFSIRSLIILLCVAALGIPVVMVLGNLGITVYLIVFWVFLSDIGLYTLLHRSSNSNLEYVS